MKTHTLSPAKIKAARQALGLTQEQIAERMGLGIIHHFCADHARIRLKRVGNSLSWRDGRVSNGWTERKMERIA